MIEDNLEEYLFEDVQKEVHSWLNVYSDLELKSVTPRDMRFYLWLKMLMDKIDETEKDIHPLSECCNPHIIEEIWPYEKGK